MDVTHRYNGDTGHGYDEFSVFLDTLDISLGTFVDTIGHADAVAGVLLGRIRTEVPDIASGIGRSDKDERPHLLIGDRTGMVGPGLRIVHKVPVMLSLEILKPFEAAPYEHQRRNQLFLDIGQPSRIELLHGVERDIGFYAFGFKQGL